MQQHKKCLHVRTGIWHRPVSKEHEHLGKSSFEGNPPSLAKLVWSALDTMCYKNTQATQINSSGSWILPANTHC